ncbi:MAG: hypothetical protein VX466_08960 [Myxococcota bacterium]|nr:hypothetical protein [Myxococcota bacterium]
MRLEYKLELTEVSVPRFSVEAQEEIGKLFTLATLVFNVLEARPKVQIVFHGLNQDDPARKIAAFQEIVESVGSEDRLRLEEGPSGRIGDSSSYYEWLSVSK